MEDLIKNATNKLGAKGLTWIEALPTTIETLSNQWMLKNIIPVNNMSYNYVAKGVRCDGQFIVLKIGCDKKAIFDEKQALAYFDDNAAIRLLDYDERHNALLLQQAIPGQTLKSLYPAQDNFVIDCYVDTVKRLLSTSTNSTYRFNHIKDWLEALDKVKSHSIPSALLRRAIDLKNSLLSTMTKEIVLHGDLHHDNILQNKDTWIVIDPKGILGEPEFEIAAFDFIHADEVNDKINIKKIFHQRLNLIAEKSRLSAERIKHWVFVRLILSGIWHVEDNGDPSWVLKLADKLM